MTIDTLSGSVFAASPYLSGFDQDHPLTEADAQAHFARGDRFCLRYLSLGAERSSDLTIAEARLILAAGLALMPVQHFSKDGWSPDQAFGDRHGRLAVGNAQALGLPPGLCVWFDLEAVALHTAQADIIAYCQALVTVVAAAGFVPGLYVGPNCGLTAAALTGLSFTHYWRAASRDLPAPDRGFQLFQGLVTDDTDPDMTADDAQGGQALWLAVASPTYPTLSPSAGPANNAVRCLQRALNVATHGHLSEDGLFGAGTRDALVAFQNGAGLPATGVADPSTWASLVSSSAK